VIELMVVLDEAEASILFINEEDGEAMGNLGQVYASALRFSSRNSSSCLLLDRFQR